ncbi:MAG: hypothetical protein WAK40_04535 [Thermoplasmata archaeon]
MRLTTPGDRTFAVAAMPVGILGLMAGGETNLQLTTPILWVMIGISTAGALVTFSFLVYAIWKFRDPSVRRRRYG